jgi:hypothetical protein
MRILTGESNIRISLHIKTLLTGSVRFDPIDIAPEDWQDAEKAVVQGKSTTVSVKNKAAAAKRKPGEALTEAYQEAEQGREKKKHKKGGKKGH